MNRALLIIVMVQSVFVSIPFSSIIANSYTSNKTNDADLAQELTNPLADLMTIPIQMNYDQNIGLDSQGQKLQINLQPVVPFELTSDVNLISRTIIPVTYQENIFEGAESQVGVGDISLSLFFSPTQPSSQEVTWGIGPIVVFPSATDQLLGSEKWSAGLTGVVLKLNGPWTYGALANHIWSFAGDDSRNDVNNTFIQPFAAYTWPSAWTVSLQSETNYNWETDKWGVPVNVAVAKLVRWGKIPVSLQAGFGYWVESPESGPEGVRFRLQANFVLPKI